MSSNNKYEITVVEGNEDLVVEYLSTLELFGFERNLHFYGDIEENWVCHKLAERFENYRIIILTYRDDSFISNGSILYIIENGSYVAHVGRLYFNDIEYKFYLK